MGSINTTTKTTTVEEYGEMLVKAAEAAYSVGTITLNERLVAFEKILEAILAEHAASPYQRWHD